MSDNTRDLMAGTDPYDALDECVKAFVTRKEYAWMPDAQKQTLIEDLTEPNVVE